MPPVETYTPSQILYSCYFTRSREGEQFVPEHVLGYQVAGTLTMSDGNKDYAFKEGDLRFCKRNHLVKFTKQPPLNGEFKAVSIYFDQETLRRFSREQGIEAEGPPEGDPILHLNEAPLYKSYMKSLIPYLIAPPADNKKLLELKTQEALFLLLKLNPELKNVLFDFNAPGKIDLEAFMNRNYHFNVELKRFAYLTGRSLTTFKRDFEKQFHNTPSRWLQQRRLQEAHYLIREKGKAPSDIYLDLGFEDLSHFSYVFKKTYGVAPTKIT